MLIAIDYDGTYDKDPELWESFYHIAKRKGHDLVCVTNRENPPEIEDSHPSFVMHCAGQQMKRKFMEDKNIKIDVWIDDMPETIAEVFVLRGKE